MIKNGQRSNSKNSVLSLKQKLTAVSIQNLPRLKPRLATRLSGIRSMQQSRRTEKSSNLLGEIQMWFSL
jgi:hypothetical protein